MDIDYRVDGPLRAPVLVLSNSLGTRWAMWQPLMPLLEPHFRVVRYNPRGHGRTPLAAEPLTLARLGQDVLALLDRLSVQRAAFCGISLGGLTGLWLNRYAPQCFSAFVVANTAARIGSADSWRARAEQVRGQGMATVAASAASRWFTPDFCQQQPASVAALVESLAGQDPQGYAACCDALAAADLRSELPAMTRPVLAIAGSDDPITTIAEAEEIVHRAPDARLCRLPASHLSAVSCAPAFARQLIAFIGGEASHVADH